MEQLRLHPHSAALLDLWQARPRSSQSESRLPGGAFLDHLMTAFGGLDGAPLQIERSGTSIRHVLGRSVDGTDLFDLFCIADRQLVQGLTALALARSGPVHARVQAGPGLAQSFDLILAPLAMGRQGPRWMILLQPLRESAANLGVARLSVAQVTLPQIKPRMAEHNLA